jgi:hypothetical protein
MFRQFPAFTVLPNLIKQIPLIYLLSVLKFSQTNHEVRFILVTLYQQLLYSVKDRLILLFISKQKKDCRSSWSSG